MGVLRLFFAFSVMLGHTQVDLLISPIYAVQGFYIISGFYMSFILNEKYSLPKQNVTFFKKRFMRLLPTYWLVAAISLIIAILLYKKGLTNIFFFDFLNYPDNASFLTYLYTIFTNIFVIGQDISLFLGISPDSGDLFFSTAAFAECHPMARYGLSGVSWSIASEFLFYIIAPFILRHKKPYIIILFVISLFSNYIVNAVGLNDSNWRFRFFPSELMFFLTGYISYLIYLRISKSGINTSYKYLFLSVILLLSIVVLRSDLSYAYHTAFLLVSCAISIPYLFYSFKFNTIDKYIGEMSYPLYLIHPVFIGINVLAGFNSSLFIITCSVLASFICYKYFIMPIEKYRSKIA